MNGTRILLVDDEVEFSAVLAKLLRRRGLEVDVVHSGEAALAAMRGRSFQVVLLDVKMPGRDGIEILGEMKRDAPDTEVILITGHLSGSEEMNGLASGAFAYLLKPYPIPDLLARIMAAAAKSKRDIR